MQNKTVIHPIEKIISVLTYITFGIVGLVWYLVAIFTKKKLKFFLMYNIIQSMIISVFLAFFRFAMTTVLMILAKIPFLGIVAALINFIYTIKIIKLPIFHISFTLEQFLVTLLIAYIIWGVVLGKIFYIPYLTKFTNLVVKNTDKN